MLISASKRVGTANEPTLSSVLTNNTQMVTWDTTTLDTTSYNASMYTTGCTSSVRKLMVNVTGNASVNCSVTDPTCQWNNAKTALEIVFLLTLAVNLFASAAIFSVPIDKRKQYANVQFCLRVLNILDVMQSLLLATMPLMPKYDCTWTGGNISCNALGYVLTILLVLSPYVITVMGFDRYMMVRRPLTARAYMTQSTTAKIIITISFFLVIQMALPFFGVGQYILYKGRGLCVLDMYSSDSLSLVITGLYLGEGMLSVIMLTVWTIIILIHIRRMTSRLSETSIRHQSRDRHSSNARSFTRMTLAIALLYVICYVPFLLRKFTEITIGGHYVTHGPLATATFGLIFLNPLLNPIVYISFNRKYRVKLRQMLCCIKSRKNMNETRATLGSKPSTASISSGLSSSTAMVSMVGRTGANHSMELNDFRFQVNK